MIPFQGLVAEIFAIIGLVRLWRHPLPLIWWTLLILFFVEWGLCRVLKRELHTKHPSKLWGLMIPTAIAQLAEIGIGIYSLF
jgi:hypothetical protein